MLFIGAGEMIELAATHFAARKPKSITVANRTLERGRELAARFNATAITLNEMPDRLPQFDIIVTCTASTLPILGKGLLERVIKRAATRRSSSSTSRCRATSSRKSAQLDDVFLYSIDDLSAIVKDNLQIRKDSVVQAEAMIADAGRPFPALARSRARSCRRSARCTVITTSCARTNSTARGGCCRGGAAPEPVLDALARGLTNKFLHAPLAGAQPGRRRRAHRAAGAVPAHLQAAGTAARALATRRLVP